MASKEKEMELRVADADTIFETEEKKMSALLIEFKSDWGSGYFEALEIYPKRYPDNLLEDDKESDITPKKEPVYVPFMTADGLKAFIEERFKPKDDTED